MVEEYFGRLRRAEAVDFTGYWQRRLAA